MNLDGRSQSQSGEELEIQLIYCSITEELIYNSSPHK